MLEPGLLPKALDAWSWSQSPGLKFEFRIS